MRTFLKDTRFKLVNVIAVPGKPTGERVERIRKAVAELVKQSAS